MSPPAVCGRQDAWFTPDKLIRGVTLITGGAQAAGGMPSRDRQLYIRRRLRFEYEQSRGETRPERIECVASRLSLPIVPDHWTAGHSRTRGLRGRFLLRLAETQLETVQVQAEHLAATFSSPDYHRV